MNCDEVRRLFHRFVDNEMDEEDRRAVKEHLEECRRCNYRVRITVRLKTTIVEKFSVRRAPSDLLERIKSNLF